jgi:molybdopterin synthase catalytic subunit
MHIELRDQCFDPWAEITAFRARMLSAGQYGACAVFVGTMRDYNDGDRVRSMYLEHYPGMTEKQLESLVNASCETNNLMEALVVHRVGSVNPGEDIVLVAVWSAHRKASFDACREIMEALKSTAPFWKKETLDDQNGERWVHRNTPSS